MDNPSDELIKFKTTVCPDLEFEDRQFFLKLLEEITKKS